MEDKIQNTAIAERYADFVRAIGGKIPGDRIYTDYFRRFAWGTDAGFYRLVPQVVVRSVNEEEISLIMETASSMGLPVTFRAAGTSLSGQSVSDSIIVVAGKNWENYSLNGDATRITLQPGLTGGRINDILRPFGRKFGPDPASVKSCMAGGIVMNNASGMSCGTVANSDRLMVCARMVLADGTVLDTGDIRSRDEFSRTHKSFIDKILVLRDEIRADQELSSRIRRKYSIKNVTGLNLLPFLEHDDPFDIMAHLLVGSEGTLAFLSEVTMETVPLAPCRASAMVYFDTMREADSAAVVLRKLKVSAAELLDSRSLAAVKDDKGMGHAALLIETEAFDENELAENVREISSALDGFRILYPVRFTSDPSEYAGFWAMRSGVFPVVGSMREQGTTCMIEDVAFHIEDLPDAVEDLSELLDRYGYKDSCIYGHVLEGNVHFIINQHLDSDAEVARYEAMLKDIVSLVVDKYDGSLKAEHGTGRNMAPFVSREWGERAFGYMRMVKDLFDPDGILNRGVIFNDDPRCSFSDLKRLPVISPGAGAPQKTLDAYRKANKCIECGFCEVNCMSAGFTLSSRTRIVMLREISRLEQTGEDAGLAAELKAAYRYPGEETCAGDGLCSTSCPMGINVADITHEVRRIAAGPAAVKLGRMAAGHFPAAKSLVRGTLNLAWLGRCVMGRKLMEGTGNILHKAGLPLWTESLPASYRMPSALAEGSIEGEMKVVYLPSCINQTMGLDRGAEGHRPLVEEMVSLLSKAGYGVIFPENLDSLCCGTIWESKGMPGMADKKLAELEEALYKASAQGKYPVVCDQSPCTHRIKENVTRVDVYDSVEFIWKFMRDRLEFTRRDEPVAVHLTCSSRLMKIDRMLVDLASLCSSEVIVPEGIGCCGFAGDKGMVTPELNAYGLRKLRGQISSSGVKTGYSNSRTCEIGLRTNSGIPYRSVVYLVNECTRAKV